MSRLPRHIGALLAIALCILVTACAPATGHEQQPTTSYQPPLA